ncbi:thiamine-monophosphate kinase [Legionella antarctica]|uniref:Thiamine-monophosphate kinase n=1 Tax=Legionella antarctica TaxID=2708020 RepID=A0A6F8T2F2_9GAMM|nr:thiamine-phosphate kinase [Legionella antarctica]BCA94864.1 thiamine-monophosphate kinase [Legionella antarctica]
MNEFSIIEQFFKPFTVKRKEVLYGIGDDAACLQIPTGNDVLISTDTLVSGVHFLPEWDPYDIACKAAMVNISDMAAMAAEPCCATLALTLPELNHNWLESFSRGLNASFNTFNVDLIGGDTTHGPLSITLTIMGLVPQGQAIRRKGAKPGDIILVSGQLGAAALAVKLLTDHDLPEEDKTEMMNALLHPKPRVDLIPILRSYASSAIDISDGLSADLNHICVASGVGACLTKEAIPIHRLLDIYWGDEAVDLALTGGDDYELCFTVSPQLVDTLMKKCHRANLVCYPIGVIEDHPGLRMKAADKACEELRPAGYSHF